MIPKRIKIKFNGPGYMAVAYDADTDEIVPNVQRVDWVTADVDNGIYEARLVVHVSEFEGEMVAPAKPSLTLSDADIDAIARRVQQRMAAQIRLAKGLEHHE